MNSSRRSKFEIWSEILEFCLWKKRSQTWLLRNTRLNTNAIKESLQFLLSRNLIDQINEGEIVKYQISDKGKEALEKFYTLINDYFNLNQEKRKKKKLRSY